MRDRKYLCWKQQCSDAARNVCLYGCIGSHEQSLAGCSDQMAVLCVVMGTSAVAESVTCHSDAGVSNREVPAVLAMCLQEDLSDFLWNAAQPECDGTHEMPLNHSAQTAAVHDNPEPFFLFHCFYFLIFMVSARPGQNDVAEYPSSLVLALMGVTLDRTKSAWTRGLILDCAYSTFAQLTTWLPLRYCSEPQSRGTLCRLKQK